MSVKAKKHLGQHFLTDESIAQQIADSLVGSNYNKVLEIGPGMGVLTKYLLEKPYETFVVEIDKESVDYLQAHYLKLANNIFSLDATSNVLWAVYGDYDTSYNPYALDSYGISKFSTSGWLNIPYSEVFDAKSITRILVNPNNEKQVFASSFFSGLLKIEKRNAQIHYKRGC